MEAQEPDVQVTCRSCGKKFPVQAIAKEEEIQEATAVAKRGGGTVRVARWSPWCSETNVIVVPIGSHEDKHVVVYCDLAKGVTGVEPKPAEEIER